MKFNKDVFIEKYGDMGFNLLWGFLRYETDFLSYEKIEFLLLENMRSFDYEGNEYCIRRNAGSKFIEIINEVAEENNAIGQTRLYLPADELLEIFEELEDILKEYERYGSIYYNE